MMTWGILSPEATPSFRRQQTLGLAGAVRHFNDRSVPGLGDLWFAMPVIWSVIAVSIANSMKRPALPVGNAVEALVMKRALVKASGSETGIADDARLRGKRKLAGQEARPSFQTLVRPGVYVVQPIRMGMIQPLVSLGFVKGSRYSSFTLAEAGERLLQIGDVRHAKDLIARWAAGEAPRGLDAALDGLSPFALPGKAASNLIRSQLLDGNDDGSLRRRSLVTLGQGPSSAQLEQDAPLPGISVRHWKDLRAGAAFMDLQHAALVVLSRLDDKLHQLRNQNPSATLSVTKAAQVAARELGVLQSLADLLQARIWEGDEQASRAFLRECLSLQPEALIAKLAERDSSVIALRDGALTLGPAGAHADGPVPRDPVAQGHSDAPFAPQLFRLKNLDHLNRNLMGENNTRQNEPAAAAQDLA